MSDIKTIFLRIKCGIGDNVQFAIVVRHLRHYWPQAHIKIECPPGCECIYRGLADEVGPFTYPYKPWGYDLSRYICMARPRSCQIMIPSTKAARCLAEEFPALWPKPEFFYYSLDVRPEVQAKAKEWRARCLPSDFAIVHNEPSDPNKGTQLLPDELDSVIDQLKAHGYGICLMHWKPSKLANGYDIVQPPADLFADDPVETAAALIREADCFVGIGSGPAILAATHLTPALIYWRNFHPVHCFDSYLFGQNTNVMHVMHERHWDWMLNEIWSLTSKRNEWIKTADDGACYSWRYFRDNYQATNWDGTEIDQFIDWVKNV